MNDLFLDWGGDLMIGTSGDIAIAPGSDTIRQRIFRRLLTNAGDYIWNLEFGAGLGQFVGAAVSPAEIEAAIRGQLSKDSAVPSDPPPTVSAKVADAATGTIVANLTYTEPGSDKSIHLNIIPS